MCTVITHFWFESKKKKIPKLLIKELLTPTQAKLQRGEQN